MDTGAGIALLAELRVGIPAGIKKHKEDADVVFVGNGEECVDAVLETGGVLLPEKVVEKDAHGVEADGLGPAEFEINALGIERVGLPHFELVDGGGGDEVAANEPRLLSVPIVGALLGPKGGLSQGECCR